MLLQICNSSRAKRFLKAQHSLKLVSRKLSECCIHATEQPSSSKWTEPSACDDEAESEMNKSGEVFEALLTLHLFAQFKHTSVLLLT